MDVEIEKLLEKYIVGQIQWERLPIEVKIKLQNSAEVWKDAVIKYSIRHQLKWKTNIIRNIFVDERQYYQELINFSRLNLMVC